MLKHGGKLHIVGDASQVQVPVLSLISSGKSIGGSPTGGLAIIKMMLDFCNGYKLEPILGEFPLSKVNDALEHLEAEGNAHYSIVLKIDF